MHKNDLIADKIEAIIQQMFTEFGESEYKPTEFGILHNPVKSNLWFIPIFFADNALLQKNLNNGICYKIYQYLLGEFDKTEDIDSIEYTIIFEPGSCPATQAGYDNLYAQLLEKREASMKDADQANIKICNNCGHNFDKHQLMTIPDNENSTPTSGWILCPEDGCNCLMTWGASYKTK